ncbi:PRC-barrel domain-containing protein [Candidatus Pacearchaeota archaeon]|nr:PRC-barrel domain-containing protein [Candidatus Pacearchaeota archaeon]
MQSKSISGKNLNRTITSDDILGKEVIDLDGRFIGVVEKVLIDPIDLDFIGIDVDKGFLKKGLSIGKNYIDRISDAAIFLKIRVVYEIKGMTVFDKIGAKVGVVSDIELLGNRNKIKNIYIRRGVIKKDLTAPAEFIEIIGHNVILSIKKEKLLSYNKS